MLSSCQSLLHKRELKKIKDTNANKMLQELQEGRQDFSVKERKQDKSVKEPRPNTIA